MSSGELQPSRLEVANTIPRANSELGFYLEYLDLSVDDIRGTTLDLGSGDTELFSREMSELGIEVISMDPNLVFQKNRDFVLHGQAYFEGYSFFDSQMHYTDKSPIPWQEKSVAGLAQEMPFKDESFDTIVSTGAIPVYLPVEDLQIGLEEVWRVLKPGGNAYLGPMADLPYESFRMAKFEAALQAANIPYTLSDKQVDGMDETFFSAHIIKPIEP